MLCSLTLSTLSKVFEGSVVVYNPLLLSRVLVNLLTVEVEELRGEVEELQAEIDGLKRDRDELDSERTREVAKLQHCLSAERLDLEQKYKLEISDLEDTYLKEKELIIKTFTKQKVISAELTLI